MTPEQIAAAKKRALMIQAFALATPHDPSTPADALAADVLALIAALEALRGAHQQAISDRAKATLALLDLAERIAGRDVTNAALEQGTDYAAVAGAIGGAWEALRGQVAALRAALLDERGSRGFPSRGPSVALADTEAAACKHDGVVRARAFGEAFEEAAKDAREIANIPDHMGDIQYRNGALMVAKALDDKAALVRAELKRGGR